MAAASSDVPPPPALNFAEDLGRPKIVPVVSKSDLVSFDNLFYRDATAGPPGPGGNLSGGAGGSGESSGPSSSARPPAPPRAGPRTDRLTQALLASYSGDTSHRDAGAGAWTFPADAERDLLRHVENGLAEDLANMTESQSAAAILRSIDVYCLGKQWMYHVGHEKGDVIRPFLRRCVEAEVEARRRRQASEQKDRGPFVVAELGTYCGYSAILLAATVRECAPDLDFHVYSTEIDANHLEVAAKMIAMAKLEGRVTLIHIDPAKEKLSDVLGRRIPPNGGGDTDGDGDGEGEKRPPKIDFLFLDHAKDLYLEDLKELEDGGFLREGSHVAADNVVVSSELGAYREYVASLAERGVAETSMVEGRLEYTENLKDGIEFTVYLRDPPERNR